MEAAQRRHEETELGLTKTSNVVRDQLEEARLELRKARIEVEVSQTRAEKISAELERTQNKVQKLEAALEAKAQSEEGWRTSYLQSADFKQSVSVKTYSFFETGFRLCRDQFEEDGLIPMGRENFPSLDKAIASLSDDEDEIQKPGNEDNEAAGQGA